jgi:hypothetical protein
MHHILNFVSVNKIPFRVSITLVILLTSFTACNKRNISDNQISEGVIQYDIAYSNRSGQNFPFQLLPKVMELKFNENFSSYTLEDRLGLFSISNILDFSKRQHITLIKVFDKKYVYRGKKGESSVLFDSSVNYEMKYLEDTARLVGYLCKTVSIKDLQSKQNFQILYSHTIGNNKPNANTPYESVEGMLLDFRLVLKNLEMHLKAKSVEQKKIKDNAFEVPKEYKEISRKKMEEILTTILP